MNKHVEAIVDYVLSDDREIEDFIEHYIDDSNEKHVALMEKLRAEGVSALSHGQIKLMTQLAPNHILTAIAYVVHQE